MVNFAPGRQEEYDGERSAGAIVEYMLRQNDPDWKPPPSTVVALDAENFTKFVKQEKLTLVGHRLILQGVPLINPTLFHFFIRVKNPN
jgi:hypothetical protein